MAVSLAAHRDKKEANSKLPSKEFIKKYKWWLVAGLAIGLVAFMYFRGKGGGNNGTSAAQTGTGGGTGFIDATGAGSGGSGSTGSTGSNGTSDGSSNGSSSGFRTLPLPFKMTPPPTSPAVTLPLPAKFNVPGSPPVIKRPTLVNGNLTPVTATPLTATLLPVRSKFPVKRTGYPLTARLAL